MSPEIQILISSLGVLAMIGIAVYKRKNTSTDKILDKIAEKMDTQDCKDFRTRIGTESMGHTRHIQCVKEDISEIKAGIAYIEGRYNSDV